MPNDATALTAPPVPIRLDPWGVESGRRSRALNWALQRLARHAWFVEDEVAGLADLIGPGDVSIDVGAEYGLYTHAMAALVGHAGTVIACEPQADAAASIQVASSVIGTHQVRLCTLAVADLPGQAALDVPLRRGRPVHGRAHLVAGATEVADPNDEFHGRRTMRVPVTTIDELVPAESLERVDYLKVDVEGAEGLVVDGAARTLAEHRPLVQLEIEARFTARFGETPTSVVERLTELDYRMYGWFDHGWAPVHEVTADRRNYLFAPG